MADRLTQLQDCLDHLATQMFASINYITTHHSFAPIPGQPDMSQDPALPPPANANASNDNQQQQQQQQQPPQDANAPVPDPPDVFKAALRELARDLVVKEQQIEYLISVLPGIGESEKSQHERIRVLERELREVDVQRKEALEKREVMLDTLSTLAAECKRVY